MSTLHEVTYDRQIEFAVSEISNILQHQYVLSKRAIALLLLQEDEDILAMVKEKEKNNYLKISQIIE
ncbi:MAG: hypothetical protein JL57_15990, partial [Desulfosporosinus sp. BICA1-9]